MAKSNEPIVWSLFSAGGVLTALVIPVLIVLLGFAEPLGLIKHDAKHIEELLGHWLTKVFLVSLVSLALFHWAHRFRFTLVDIGLKSLETLIAVACYGTAVIGTLIAVYVVWF